MGNQKVRISIENLLYVKLFLCQRKEKQSCVVTQVYRHKYGPRTFRKPTHKL